VGNMPKIFFAVQWYSPGCTGVHGTPPNTCFLGPTRVHNPDGISIGSGIFAQLVAECRRHDMACPSPKNCAFTLGNLDPTLVRGSLGPPESFVKMAC